MNWTKLTKDILQNYPDYSTEWIKCIYWKYDDMDDFELKFEVDYPDDDIKVMIVTNKELPDVINAAKKLAHLHIDNEVSLYGYKFDDPGSYDLIVLDCVMQLYFFNNIVYG